MEALIAYSYITGDTRRDNYALYLKKPGSKL